LSFGFNQKCSARFQTGNSRRIGIDREKKTALVQTGLFPTMPNALSLLFLVPGFVLIQIQERLEEEFPTNLHAEKYAKYRRRL